MANSKPLMAKSSGTDHANAAVAVGPAHARCRGQRHRRDRRGAASPISARAFAAAADLIRNAKGRADRHRARQVRPYRPQDRRDPCLHRHAGLLRARRGSQPRRSRHDHRRRRHHGAVMVRRAAGDEEPHHLCQALPHPADRDDRGTRTRRWAQAADIALTLPKAREACPHNLAPTTSSLMHARARRCAGDRAAGRPRLHLGRFQRAASRRQARRDAEISSATSCIPATRCR